MKTEMHATENQLSRQYHATKGETIADRLVLAEFAFGTLAGVISFVAAVLTTVVEVPGLWRSFWLIVCIVTFLCALGLIVEGARNFAQR